MDVLAVNSGSSSLKLRLVGEGDRILAGADLPPAAPAQVAETLETFLEQAPPPAAAAHRFVHGGAQLREPVLLDEGVLATVASAGVLAPLHNEAALACARELRRLRPRLPQVACFDTVFHRSLPDAAATYAVPWEWIERHGLRRFGFHGLSHAWASRRTAELLERPVAELRTVTCHLGAGVSLAAVEGGRSVETTMGATPNDGVAMATRSGAVDPSAVLMVAELDGLSPRAVRDALEHRSGLSGLSGLSGEMRELIGAVERGHERARLALDVYVHRLRAAVAAMAAAMGGLDALAFTGGVGENAARVRAEVCAGLGFLGIALDADLNEGADGDAVLSPADARTAGVVVRAREELQMATEARSLISG